MAIKMQKPKMPKLLERNIDIKDQILTEEILECQEILDTTLEEIESLRLKINGCIFKNVIFDECSFQKVDMVDVIFENCNLSNVDFSEGGLCRVEFLNCKLTGAKLYGTTLQSVYFENSVARYANFSFSKFKGVELKSSDFTQAVFQEIKNEKFVVQDTNLTKTIFRKTPLKDMDFTTCNIENMEMELPDLNGGIFTVVQALDLAKLMGITIK